MAKLTLNDVSNISGAESTAINTINNNSAAIETALENTLSRDGTNPNQMNADLDMNSNDVINVSTLSASSLVVDGSNINTAIEDTLAAADAATTSATNAATSATNAASSATNAASSASSASTSATNAASSASVATTKAGEAATSASAAATSATTATNAASSASTSATNAANSASSANSAKDQTLAAFNDFDDRYLGVKTSDPTLDNSGNALSTGALYYNSVDEVVKVYTGSAWVAAYASLGGALSAANNLSDLSDASSARTNLGLGTAATKNEGAGSGLDADTIDGIQGTSIVQTSRTISTGTGLTGGGNLTANRTISAVIATQAEAEAGTLSTVLMTPQRVSQAIDALGRGGKPDAVLSHQTASGINGGTATAGSWLTRPINTEDFDSTGLVSLSSNQFTVTDDCWCECSSLFYSVVNAQTRIYNVTDSSVVAYGEAGYFTNGAKISVSGQLLAGKTYQIEYRCSSTESSNGLGVAGGFGNNNIFLTLKLWRT